MQKHRRLWDAYRFSALRPRHTVRGIFGDPKARVLVLQRRGKKRPAAAVGGCTVPFTTARCGGVGVCPAGARAPPSRGGVAGASARAARVGLPGPKVIGIDDISLRKGHTYRIVVSDLVRRRPIWFGGQDRSEESMDLFFQELGPRKSQKIRLAVMDMWKASRNTTPRHAPQAIILFDKFHVLRHLGKALDQVRKSEYARLTGQDRRFIKGQKYTLLSHRANLTLGGRRALRTLLRANKRLNTAYLLKESFGQLWDYQKEGWARRFFETWRAARKWQRLGPYEKFAAMIERHWDGIAAFCQPDNKVALGFVEGVNNKNRAITRRAYGLRDEEYLRLKVLTCMLPEI